MRKQIGLPWLFLQGVLYILGAVIYTVGFIICCERFPKDDVVDRLVCLKSGFPEDTISGVARIRSSMYWWCLLLPHI